MVSRKLAVGLALAVAAKSMFGTGDDSVDTRIDHRR